MSAIIMLVIVMMWAAVLGPMWLRRHDAIYETRSVDRFSTAMRVLSRRGRPAPMATAWSRAVMMPARSDAGASSTAVMVSGRAGDHVRDAGPSEQLFRLRRNVGALLVVDFLTLAVWVATGSSAILLLHVMSDLLSAVAVAGLRQAAARERVRQARETRRRRISAMAREQQAVAATSPRRRAASAVWHDPLASAAQEALAHGRVSADDAAAARRTAAASAVAQSSSGVPQPRGSKVADEALEADVSESAEPVRTRRGRLPATSTTQHPRTIDLTVPGAWREAVDSADVDDEASRAAMIAEDVEFEADLDAFVARRRKVV